MGFFLLCWGGAAVVFLAEQGQGHLAALVAASQVLNKFGRRELHCHRFTASVGHLFSLKILSDSLQGTRSCTLAYSKRNWVLFVVLS